MENASSNIWFEAPAEEILDEVVMWRQLSGESVDETDPSAAKETLAMIRSARRDIARSVRLNDTRAIRIARAIDVEPDAMDSFEERGLGECWAFDIRGAYAYDGRRRGGETARRRARQDRSRQIEERSGNPP